MTSSGAMRARSGAGAGGSLTAGVVVGVVVDVNDPEGEGRVKVEFAWLAAGQNSAWAPVAAAFSGPNRGAFFAPEPGDEALVCFEHGDFNHPFIVGFLWNGVDKPPSDNPRLRIIRSLNGHELAMHDPNVAGGNQGYLSVKGASGDEMRIENRGITLTSRASIVIQAPSVVINGRPVAPVPSPI